MISLIFAAILIFGSIILNKLFFAHSNKRHLRKIITGSAIALALIVVISSCFVYVPTGYTGIVTTFGKVHDSTLDAGISAKTPWDVVILMDNREQRETFQLEAFSKDIQQVDIQGSINYNIDKTTAMNLYKNVGTEYANILIGPRIQEDVKVVIAQYTAENLIASRQDVANAIESLLREELAPKGINVISFAIENIDFTDAFETAVEAKQVATQEKQRAQTQQEQQTMEAQQAAERRRIAAEADADIAKIAAEADLEVVKIQANAALFAGEREAEMNKRISEALTGDLIKYCWIKQWNGELPTVTSDNFVPIFDMSEVLSE